MPDLCFITTCRSRLTALKQSLPTFVAQPQTDCVVVDYDCPEGTADWVTATYPQVQVVRVANQPRFEIAKARNLGAEAAAATWLCFVDADVRLSPQFAASVRPLLKARHYYRPEPRSGDLWGTCICPADDFRKIEGYDDVLQGWGKEDGDLYTRLRMIGLQPATFPGDLLNCLPHDNAARVANYDVKDRWLNATANHIYCCAKWDLMRHSQRNLPRPTRQSLYEQFHRAILEAHADGKTLELGVPLYQEKTWSCGLLEARLVYRLKSPRGDQPPAAVPDVTSGE